MTLWPPSRDRLTRPAYRAIAQALVDAVDAGEISDGARLPPQRSLAYDLGVSVQTVSRAYEELNRIGLLRGEVGRGSFVAVHRTDAAKPWQTIGDSEKVIDLSMLVPVPSARHDARMRAVLADMAVSLPDSTINSFRPRTTLHQHCDAARQWLRGCGLSVTRDRILPANGCTSAMCIALMTAALPGDLILADALTHHTVKALCGALGLRVAGVAMDGEGMIPEALDEAAAQGARAIFVMPNGLGPTLAVMSDARRNALVAVARRRDLLIVENDAWGPLTSDGTRPLAALAPERTLYVTGLSKITLPGLRIGWLVVPDRLVTAARSRHLVTAWMATPLIAEIATRWLNDGTAAEMLDFQKNQFMRRNRLAQRGLRGLDFCALGTGMHVWLRLPKGWSARDFVSHARNDGVAVGGSGNFLLSEDAPCEGVRLCLGGVGETALEEGLRILSLLAQSAHQPALLTM
jgi:DNA-binding transcriptional MocR family regulator